MSKKQINKKRLFKRLDNYLYQKVKNNLCSKEESKAIIDFLRNKGYKI